MGHHTPEGATFIDAIEPSIAGVSVGTLFRPEMRGDTLALFTAFFSCLLAVYLGFSWLTHPSSLAYEVLPITLAVLAGAESFARRFPRRIAPVFSLRSDPGLDVSRVAGGWSSW